MQGPVRERLSVTMPSLVANRSLVETKPSMFYSDVTITCNVRSVDACSPSCQLMSQ